MKYKHVMIHEEHEGNFTPIAWNNYAGPIRTRLYHQDHAKVRFVLSLQVCGFKIIRVTVSFAVTVNRNRHSKKNKENKSGSLYIILFVTTCERRELLKHHRKRRK